MKASEELLIAKKMLSSSLTVHQLVASMRQSGFALIIVFLCLPFLQPIPMAGLSTVFGLVIVILSAQMVMNRKTIWLPQFLGKRELKAETAKSLLAAGIKFFAFVETFVKPRLSVVAKRKKLIPLAICICGIMLAMPIPIPFSNMICAAPAMFFALSLLEGDGFMALLGFLAMILSIAFHAAVFILGIEGLFLIYEKIVSAI